jgi:DNA-binding transcriptional LysR family regulator
MGLVDVEALRLIVAVRDNGSIASAARALGITQPGASLRLRGLESRLGITLVLRRSGGSTLTDAGHALCGWAAPVFESLEQLELGLTALLGDARSDMNVAASRTIAEHLLPSWIAALRRKSPTLTLSLSVMNSRAVIEAVVDGRARVGFVETPTRPRDVQSRVIGWDELAVVVSPEHAWARRRTPLTSDQLRGRPLIVRERGSGTRETLELCIGEVTAPALEADSTSAIIGAALGGLGPAVLSRRAVESQLTSGALVEVPFAEELRRPLRVVWRTGDRLRAPATDLLDCITSR